jgi:hypothetical protein
MSRMGEKVSKYVCSNLWCKVQHAFMHKVSRIMICDDDYDDDNV